MRLAFRFPDSPGPGARLPELVLGNQVLRVHPKGSRNVHLDVAQRAGQPIDFAWEGLTEPQLRALLALAYRLKQSPGDPWLHRELLRRIDDEGWLKLPESHERSDELSGSLRELLRTVHKAQYTYLDRRQLVSIHAEDTSHCGLIMRSEEGAFRLGGWIEEIRIKGELAYQASTSDGRFEMNRSVVSDQGAHGRDLRDLLGERIVKGHATLKTHTFSDADIELDMGIAEQWIRFWARLPLTPNSALMLVAPPSTRSETGDANTAPTRRARFLLIYPETDRNEAEALEVGRFLRDSGIEGVLMSDVCIAGQDIGRALNDQLHTANIILVAISVDLSDPDIKARYDHLWSAPLMSQVEGDNRSRIIPLELLKPKGGEKLYSPLMLRGIEKVLWASSPEAARKKVLRAIEHWAKKLDPLS